MPVEPVQIAADIERLTPRAIEELNALTQKTFRTRGGRVGSGMGLLLESLWGYFINTALEREQSPVEIGWIATHEYNDFACLLCNEPWDAATRNGEVLRVEIKSMISSADESKAHFDRLHQELTEHDLLIVLLWGWSELDQHRCAPVVQDYFVGTAREVAKLRDELHLTRGGRFVDSAQCPDACATGSCTHGGEPLNAAGKRERLTGPASTKPANVSYAANFGGLVRMLKSGGRAARQAFQECRQRSATAHRYINFIHRNLPAEELNQYSTATWRRLGQQIDMSTRDMRATDIQRVLLEKHPNYRELLRAIEVAEIS